jgi:hypothetical protein
MTDTEMLIYTYVTDHAGEDDCGALVRKISEKYGINFDVVYDALRVLVWVKELITEYEDAAKGEYRRYKPRKRS